MEEENKNQANLEKLLSLTLSSVFSYFVLSMNGTNKLIYYKNFTHPHPLIRMTYIMTAFLDVAKIYYPNIIQKEVMNKSFEVTCKLFQSIDHEDVILNYKDTLFREYGNVMEYMEGLINSAQKIPYLVTNTFHKKK